MEIGHLHILDPARQKLLTQNYSLLLPSEHPVLIVEGASDVCAAYDLGFTAVGKPSATSKSQHLIELLSGRSVVIIGENDAGSGKAGMEQTFAQLQKSCPNLTKLMPPDGVKDLRQWLAKGLTQAELLDHIERTGVQSLGPDILDDDRALTVSGRWVKDYKTINGKLLFGIYNEEYVNFDGVGYRTLSKNNVRGQIYRDMGYMSYLDPTGALKRYKLSRAKVSDVLDACAGSCLIEKDPPCWLTPGDHPNPTRLIVFQNGILNVDDYIAGKITLSNPDPNLFTFYKMPYDFDENLESPLWDDTIIDILGNKIKVQLLSQWFGYNLVPDMSFEKLMLFKGYTRAGKGTVNNTLQALLGFAPNCSTTSFPTLAGEFGLSPLRKALSVVVGDATVANKPGSDNAILLKILNIVGRDRGIINVKHSDHIDMFKYNCRFTFAMNFFPTFRDDSGSLEERTMILTFNNSHAGREDITLKDQLEQDALSGKLINFALRGLKDLYDNKGFVIPEESAEAIRAFGELVSPLGHFIRRCIEPDPTGSGVTDDWLYEIWKWWCKYEGVKYGGKSDFIHKILAMSPNVVQIMPGEVGNADRMLMGIKVTDWAERENKKG